MAAHVEWRVSSLPLRREHIFAMWHLRLAQLPQRGALPLRHAVHGLAAKLLRECLQHPHLLVGQRGEALLRESRILEHRLVH